MKYALKLLTIFVFSVLASGCAVDRSGLGRAPDPVSWSVVPRYFCPGDPVKVSWDFSSMRKDPRNCRPPNGGFTSLTACDNTAECQALAPGSVCQDRFCCRRELITAPGSLMCDSGSGCYPAFDITITADTLSLDPPVDSESAYVRGSRTVTPYTTTTFSIAGGYVTHPPYLFEDRKTVTMVRSAPPTSVTLTFPFVCTGATPGWRQYDFNSEPMATEHVRIAEVRNMSGGHTILVQRTGSDPLTVTTPVRLGPPTELLNGRVDGVWSAYLDPRERGLLNRPLCGPTEVRNPWPDLRIELIFECAAD